MYTSPSSSTTLSKPKPAMPNPASSISLTATALLLFFHSFQAAQGTRPTLHHGAGGERSRSPAGRYSPVPTVVYRSVALPLPAATAASAAADEAPPGGYQPFELCMGCRCCASAAAAPGNNSASSCVDTQCCYAIDCNIPGKPFGVCAFSPRTCGCGGGSGNCTTQP